MRGQARSFYVTCIADARVHAHSQFVRVGDIPLVDYEGDELTTFDDYVQLDPLVFHCEGETAWMIEDERRVIEIEEAFAPLIGPHATHFGHWIWEYLPKYVTATASGSLPRVPVLINDVMPEQLRDALYFLLPDDVEVIEIPYAPIHVKRLWYAPALTHEPFFENVNERYPGPDHRCTVPARFRPFLTSLQRHADAAVPLATGIDRVYLARRDDLPRKLLNRRSVEALVRSRGFTVIYPEDHPFLDQVRLLRHARFVVGPEGSGIYLSFFSRPGSKLCVLNHPFTHDLLNFCYIVQQNDIDVTLFTGPAIRLNNEPGYPNFGFPHYADYEIDTTAFADFLDEWLEAEPNAARPQFHAGKVLNADDLTVLNTAFEKHDALLKRERARVFAGPMPPGFYRRANTPTVFKLSEDGTYCTVENESQLEAFGATDNVNVTQQEVDSFTEGYTAVPGFTCGWPDGYYQKEGDSVVFKVLGNTVRELPSSARVTERVLTIAADSDLLRRKRFIGRSSARAGV
ncbi:MAG: glycosyltransferase family 61 protein [Candidatus Eremiobacteraeota bacterium]|nr:glycosyltransferase family 61 protein [Candidatus Eremiobacteraeota bacterium]